MQEHNSFFFYVTIHLQTLLIEKNYKNLQIKKNFFSDAVKTHLRSLIKQINLKVVLILDYNFCCTKKSLELLFVYSVFITNIRNISCRYVLILCVEFDYR